MGDIVSESPGDFISVHPGDFVGIRKLIAHERIRAYKMGGKTLIDLDSIDEYHDSLPRVESRAML
ncbi:MAG: hypothetical protein JSS22_16075 [Proteobacteria bacterium]|nr:hypothetical protein [Pseudomonadota bacterium]